MAKVEQPVLLGKPLSRVLLDVSGWWWTRVGAVRGAAIDRGWFGAARVLDTARHVVFTPCVMAANLLVGDVAGHDMVLGNVEINVTMRRLSALYAPPVDAHEPPPPATVRP